MQETAARAVLVVPVERFVDRLYAPLAWEATVQLGDPSIASRLVERVLHRTWAEREQFPTFDALIRHVQESAMTAIRLEAQRRWDVTRFDDAPSTPPIPILSPMSAEAVRRRL